MLRSLKVSSFFAAAFALMFAVVSAVFYFGDWYRLIAVSCLGAFVGLVTAPVFEPTAFARPKLVQAVSGLMAGLFAGVAVGLSLDLVLAAGALGLCVGLLAPIWVKHIHIP